MNSLHGQVIVIILIFEVKSCLSITFYWPIIQTPVDDGDVGHVDVPKKMGEDPEVLGGRDAYLEPVRPRRAVAYDLVAHLSPGRLGTRVDLSCRHPGLRPELQPDRPRRELLQDLTDDLDGLPHVKKGNVGARP